MFKKYNALKNKIKNHFQKGKIYTQKKNTNQKNKAKFLT